MSEFGVPTPIVPTDTDWAETMVWSEETSGTWEPITGLSVRVTAPAPHLRVTVHDESRSPEEAVWSAVWWLRECGVPGTWKEALTYNDHTWRLGGLYCLAGFPLRDRERDYKTHGENPEYAI